MYVAERQGLLVENEPSQTMNKLNIDQDQSSALTVVPPKTWPWLWRVTLEWLVIVGLFWTLSASDHLMVGLLCIVLLGTRQHALEVLGHDATHGLVHRSRLINSILGDLLCFWPVFTSVGGFRRFHFKHHRFCGTDDDPELVHKRLIRQWSLPLKGRWIILHLFLDCIGFAVPHLLVALYLNRPVNVVSAVRMLVFWTFWLTLAYAFGCLWIPLVWVLALVTTHWASFRMRIWTEHIGTTDTHRIKLSLIQRLLIAPHNIWYHYEHHHYPGVPLWALPGLRKTLDPHMPVLTLKQLFRSLSKMECDPTGLLDPLPDNRLEISF